MPDSAHPIYAALPGLAEHLPCAGFAVLPTPVQAGAVDGKSLWIKRDDLSHPEYGGNKVRKLEFILAQARADGRRRVVSFGATGTHHGLATAIFCRKLQLECELLLFDQPETPQVRENVRRLMAEGAQLRHCHSLARTIMRYGLHPGRLRRDTLFLFAGGSNELGVLAFINAALELAEQIRAGALPAPGRIYCPLGSGSTLAGLTLGVALAGLDCEVVGVRVADARLGPFPACTEATVAALMQRCLRWLEHRGISWPARVPAPRIDHRWIGAGYGHATAAGEAAARAFESAVGVPLDPTYTAKTFAAVQAALAEEAKALLYWHTLSSAGAPDVAPGVVGALAD